MYLDHTVTYVPGPYLSRLWWAAEMTRNGEDYSAVDPCLRRVRTAQWALELKYSWYRPAAIAFVEVAEGLDGGSKLSDEEMERLSVRANAYLPLAPLEAIGFDDSDEREDVEWWGSSPTREQLMAKEPPDGPKDGVASRAGIDALGAWFRYVLAADVAAPE